MGKKEATKVKVFLFSHLLLKDLFQLSSCTERKSMTRSNLKIQMPKSHKSPRLSVRCGTTLIKQPKIDLKKSTKRTSNPLLRKSLNISKSMARLKRKRKEKTKRNDQYLTIYILLEHIHLICTFSRALDKDPSQFQFILRFCYKD